MNLTKTPSPLTDKTDKTPLDRPEGEVLSVLAVLPQEVFRKKRVPSLDRLKAVLNAPAVDSERTGGGFVSFGSASPGGSGTDSEDLAAVLGMRLSRFARSGEWLRIRSRLLGEDVTLAADNATGLPPGVPVYRAGELRFLIGLDPEGLRGVHRIKLIFAGSVHDRRRINTLGGSKNEGP